MGRIVLVASGKGGVGKSTIASSMAVSFARRGLRTLLLDADVGLRSLDLMLGMQDRVLFELSDCVSMRCSLDEALIAHSRWPLLHVMTTGQEAKPKDFDEKSLGKVMKTLRERYDLILVDAPAGIGRGFKNFLPFADQFVLAATPDEVCLRDTEKTAKIIMDARGEHPWLIINRFEKRLLKQGLIGKPEDTALMLDLPLLGIIPQDDSVYRAMLQGKTIPEGAGSSSVRALERICDRFLGVPGRDGNWIGRLFKRKEELPR